MQPTMTQNFVSDQCMQTAHSIIGTQVQIWRHWDTDMLLGHRYNINLTTCTGD